MAVESEPGRGTTFRVHLPRVDEALTPSEAPRALRRSIPASETILVVEDDRAVRNVTCRILRQAGYSVFDAGDPDRARETCVQHAGAIHLLLTDIIMPQKSGPDLALELSLLQPAMKVLYMSGYTGGHRCSSRRFPRGSRSSRNRSLPMRSRGPSDWRSKQRTPRRLRANSALCCQGEGRREILGWGIRTD